jgi:hypothetical protein
MNKVTIETKLTLDDFVKANYILLFQKPTTKLLLLVAFLMIVLPVALAISGTAPYSLVQSLIGIGLIAFYLFSTYLTARKNYNAIPGLKDALTYEFSNEQLVCFAGASSSQSTWDKVYKVTEMKHFILLWRSRQIVNVLPKRDITREQLAAIKEMLTNNKVKNNMR